MVVSLLLGMRRTIGQATASDNSSPSNESINKSKLAKFRVWKSKKSKAGNINVGWRTPTEGRQRQVTIWSYTAHGRSLYLGLKPTKASRTHSGLLWKADGCMGIMNSNKYLIEAAAYLFQRSGSIGIKCLSTEMSHFPSPKKPHIGLKCLI